MLSILQLLEKWFESNPQPVEPDKPGNPPPVNPVVNPLRPPPVNPLVNPVVNPPFVNPVVKPPLVNPVVKPPLVNPVVKPIDSVVKPQPASFQQPVSTTRQQLSPPLVDNITTTHKKPSWNPFQAKPTVLSDGSGLGSTVTDGKKYGHVPFVCFYAVVLARLAYFDDVLFAQSYIDIFGPIIPKTVLSAYDAQPNTESMFTSDAAIVTATSSSSSSSSPLPTYELDGQTHIAFNDFAQKINVSNGEAYGTPNARIRASTDFDMFSKASLRYISVGTSNYGEIYVVHDLDMPSVLFVVFRGTYSVKSAMSYTKPSSVRPAIINASTKEGVLQGIYHLLVNSIHSIMEAIRMLAAEETAPIKIITTGHSLGGALATLFAYVYAENREKQASFFLANEPHDIGCISIGAPRVFNDVACKIFEEYVQKKVIHYRRIVTIGDPVAALPPAHPPFSFMHPCSSTEEMRKEHFLGCQSLYKSTLGKPKVNYDGDLFCSGSRTPSLKVLPLNHTIYLNVLFRNAVDMGAFLGSAVSKITESNTLNQLVKIKSTNLEIRKFEYGNTTGKPIRVACRIAFFNLTAMKSKGAPAIVFFDLEDMRRPGGNEAVYVNATFFQELFEASQPIRNPDEDTKIITTLISPEAFSQAGKATAPLLCSLDDKEEFVDEVIPTMNAEELAANQTAIGVAGTMKGDDLLQQPEGELKEGGGGRRGRKRHSRNKTRRTKRKTRKIVMTRKGRSAKKKKSHPRQKKKRTRNSLFFRMKTK